MSYEKWRTDLLSHVEKCLPKSEGFRAEATLHRVGYSSDDYHLVKSTENESRVLFNINVFYVPLNDAQDSTLPTWHVDFHLTWWNSAVVSDEPDVTGVTFLANCVCQATEPVIQVISSCSNAFSDFHNHHRLEDRAYNNKKTRFTVSLTSSYISLKLLSREQLILLRSNTKNKAHVAPNAKLGLQCPPLQSMASEVPQPVNQVDFTSVQKEFESLAISCPPEIIQSAPPEHISLPSLVSWIPIPLDNDVLTVKIGELKFTLRVSKDGVSYRFVYGEKINRLTAQSPFKIIRLAVPNWIPRSAHKVEVGTRYVTKATRWSGGEDSISYPTWLRASRSYLP